jgi:hypothetical protein
MKMLTGLLATLVVSTQLPAAEPHRDVEPPHRDPESIQGAQLKFASLDRDGDRKLSRAEADGALAARFASVDADNDGYIDESEYVSHVAVPSDERDRGIRDEEIIEPFDPSNPAR